MSPQDPLLERLSAQVADALIAHGTMLALAESCTGGGVAATLTARAGSSAWFDRGFVTYSNAAKMRMLGVPESLLIAQGAVSEACALAMAEGALIESLANWSIAITGIAGPTGGTPTKPVGTVCFAWVSREGRHEVETCHFQGNRDDVRYQAIVHALSGLIHRLQSVYTVLA